jgi:hypothetical protein
MTCFRRDPDHNRNAYFDNYKAQRSLQYSAKLSVDLLVWRNGDVSATVHTRAAYGQKFRRGQIDR